MAHIHTGPGEHDLTASAYVIRETESGPKLMLHWHKKLQRWMQFGGHVELHENPWQAIAHELIEESGLELDQVKVLQPKLRLQDTQGRLHPTPLYTGTFPFPGAEPEHWHTDIGWAFVTHQEPRHEIAEPEQTEHRLVSAAELLAMTNNETFENVRQIGAFILEELMYSWEQVDTATFKI